MTARSPRCHAPPAGPQAILVAALVIVSLLVVPSPSGAARSPLPPPFDRLVCGPRFGVTFCQGGLVAGADRRVPSFDGVPIDADLTLPASGRAPYPLIVLLHGLGGNKLEAESTKNDGALDNVTLASDGWAVLTYSARGFGESCGTALSRENAPACAKGWVHLADERYEVRDTQYLAGMLVDEGYARPGIAVSGVSYGGGQTLELAMLKNRMVLPDGKLVPFLSPARHIAMTIAAAYAMWPWEDLDTALIPNGRLSTAAPTPAKSDRSPIGVAKEEWDAVLYAAANAAGFLPPAGVDPQSDLTSWERATVAGEPFGAAESAAVEDLQRYKSAIAIPMAKGGPAPTAIQSGWTDSLFPVSEALHFANDAAAAGSRSPILLVFDDVGHPWAQDKAADVAFNDESGIGFLNAIVLHHRRPRTGVLVRAQSCPATAPSGPTVAARSWAALGRGTTELVGRPVQRVTSGGGDPEVAAALDGVSRPLCANLPAASEPGTATYSMRVGRSGLHVLGGARITAELAVTGSYPELVGRLWDVAPGGATRQIIELGAFRPSLDQSPGPTPGAPQTERISFELPPNDYVVAPGHALELELVGANAPFFRRSNGVFSIAVSDLVAMIPLGGR